MSDARKITLDALEDACGVVPDHVDQTLSDLGLDSLDQVELLMELEVHLVDVVDGDFAFSGAHTVQQIIDLVKESQNGGDTTSQSG